jgi:DNA-binding NarL/FixJ family response regulator
LRQVATVVENGGVWIGQSLMQRFLAASARLLPERAAEKDAWRGSLTPREQEVATELAKGASNKEIARQLDITERTVKAHVGATLEKLGARDRLQLSLIINGIEKTR